LISAQIGSTDWAVHQQLFNSHLCCDAKHCNALSHAREEMVCFFDRPYVGPTVFFDQQSPKWVGGLFAKNAVWGNKSKSSTFFENLQASFDEQAIEVDVSTHGREPGLSVISQGTEVLSEFTT
jgi:hypothetical protein